MVAELFYPIITHLQYTNSLQKCGNTTFPNKLVLQVGCTEAVGFHSNPDTGLKEVKALYRDTCILYLSSQALRSQTVAHIKADNGATSRTKGERQCYSEKLRRIYQDTSDIRLG